MRKKAMVSTCLIVNIVLEFLVSAIRQKKLRIKNEKEETI